MKTIQELRDTENKLSIFMDFNQLTQYVETIKDLIDAFSMCLNDDEKLEIMTKSNYFSRLKSNVQTRIIMTIEDDKIKGQIIRNKKLMETAFDQYSSIKFIKTANDESKLYFLNNPDMIEKFNVSEYEIKTIIEGLANENRVQILSNQEMVKRLRIEGFQLTNLIIGLDDDNIKNELAQAYKLDTYYKILIIKSFSDENKKSKILEDNENLKEWQIAELISTLGVDAAIDFINNEQEFLSSKSIKAFNITRKMPLEKQLELVEKIEQLHLPEAEKRRIFAVLTNETKKEIAPDKVDEKYRQLLEIEAKYGRIIPKLDGDLTQYADLDELLSVNPLKIVKTNQDRQALLKLCQICPNMDIEDNIEISSSSTTEEYLKGEQWISSILEGIKPGWTDVQKLAYIDTMIGKRISYTPNLVTEAEKTGDARALWKIISNGYGVCNGIAQIEQYLLGRVGIDSEKVGSGNHSFVKVKNIQIPTENGIVQGDTLVDPTWNLTASRYGCFPQHFCKSYEELRKVDIDLNGKDHECHKNDELEETPTIDMDINSLREVYRSIGIADKDGNFPVGQLIEQARQVDETSTDMQSNITNKFALLKKWCPEFATCQNSTINIIRDVLFEHNEHFEFKRCIASRVYEREDTEKQAVLYVYMELEDGQKQFFYADKENGEFVTKSQQEFEQKFECYEKDMEKLGQKRPWEIGENIQENKANSSGEIVAEEEREHEYI